MIVYILLEKTYVEYEVDREDIIAVFSKESDALKECAKREKRKSDNYCSSGYVSYKVVSYKVH